MFAMPGLILVLLTDYFKPQEFVPLLAGVPLLYLFTALTLAGFVIDLRLGLSRLVAAPQLALGVLFVAWSVFTNVRNGSGELLREGFALLIPVSLYLLIAHCVQTLRMLRVVMGLVLAMGIAVAFIGTHQGLAPWGCHRPTYERGKISLVHDGRPCPPEDRGFCNRDENAEPGVDYVCERVGLLGTQSYRGRVRFRGTMEDPNELSLAVVIAIPLAFAFFDARRTAARLALFVGTIVLAGICAVLTRSRGGQVVFLVTLGVYFVKRLGVRGLVAGLACALPVLLLGGRGSAEAAASTLERYECWAEGLAMLRRSPLLGVGLGQFTEHHYLTAHNSQILTAAELGFPGMLLWTAVVYVSVKIPVQVLRASRGPPALPQVAVSWSFAMTAALAGLIAGMFFLSYAYKEVLWIYLGLTGALYQVVRRHQPSFRVTFGVKELLLLAALNFGLLAATMAVTRLKLGY